MKKFLLSGSIAALLLPGLALAVNYNDVSLTSSTVLSVNGIEIDVSSTATLSSITVDTTSFSVVLGPGSTLKVTAPGRNQMTLTGASGYLPDTVCSDTDSHFRLAATAFDATTTVTVTPSSSLCPVASSGGGGGGSSGGSSSTGSGGGGGGGIYVAPATTPTTPAGTNAALIAQLQSQINALMAQLTALQGGASPGTQGSGGFKRDLQMGTTGSDVMALQAWLNAHGYVITATGAGSPGNETTRFGALTRAALIKFQKAVGISPAAGFFGPKTRAYIAAH